MKVRFLAPHEVPAEFDRLRPVFERVPAEDEYSVSDIVEQGSIGHVAVGYVEDGGQIVAVMAYEFLRYLRTDAVNILALAGCRLDEVHAEFFEGFKALCREAGVTSIEARCSEAMARLLRRYGFEFKCQIVSVKL